MTVFWALLAVAAGTLQYAASRVVGGDPGWLEHVAYPALAAALWVPLTLIILWLARRWPPPPFGPLQGAVVHGTGALAVSFVLNAGFVGVLALGGRVAAADLGGSVLEPALRWMHLNAGTYVAIVGVGLAARQSAGPGIGRGEAGPIVADRLEVSSGAGTVYLPVDEIDWIEGAGDYTRVHAGERQLLCDRRLHSLERLLAPRAFARVHRSRILNLVRVREMRHLSHGDYEAELVGGERVRVSRSRRDAVLAAMDRLTVDPRGDG